MNFIIEDTIQQYETLFSLNEGREDYFRYTMMKPFEAMWRTINVPLKAKQPGGYDVLMAAQMLGFLGLSEDELGHQGLALWKGIDALQTAGKTFEHCLHYIEAHSLSIKADTLKFGLYLADPKKLELQKGYCGFGGIPGYIHVTLYPNAYNIPRLPAVIAHEFHHNIRFSYFDWDHGDVTVGDYAVIEGLAESFAKELYGEELLGPWVTSFDKEDLAYSLGIIGDALQVKGFAEVSSYMFGDVIAKEQGFQAVGLSPFAGYAVGYRIVQSFMQRNRVTVSEATLLSTADILDGSGLFT